MRVLLPVKDLHSCKSRLAESVPLAARQSLMAALLQDLLATLARCREVEGVTVVTRCPSAAALAEQAGAQVLDLPEDRGLNAAVTAGVARLADAGVPSVLIMHADLPLARPEDIDRLIRAHREAGVAVTLVPDNRGDGTNALLLSLPSPLAFHYGPGSCDAHQREAATHALRCQVLSDAHVGTDIDLWEDVQPLAAAREQLVAGELTAWLARYADLFALPRAANL